MTYRTAVRSALALATTLLLLSTFAHAQLFRTYLAPTGSDANPCTLQQPCRLLPAALTAVASGGEIWMLDSANYNTGPVNITKSVTILAVPGALGSVVAAGGNAIDIATAGVNVALRNLVIVPLLGGGGTGGINMTAGAALAVENCLFANLPQRGISVNANASVRITDTTIRDGGAQGLWLEGGANATVTRATISGHNSNGVYVLGSGANTTTADVADSTVDSNFHGVYAYSSNASGVVRVSVSGSLIARNLNIGFLAQSAAAASVTLSAGGNMISNNAIGMSANTTGSKIWASGNTVSDNGTYGLWNNGGLLESAGNNAVRNNGTNKIGTISVVLME